MKISDLSALVTATKADWLPSETWMGFSPKGTSQDAKGKCEATINRQFGAGYVLERVTTGFGQPNIGFEDDQRIKEARNNHAKYSDCLMHIHKLRPSAKPLQDIIGKEDFEFLQNAWSQSTERVRWSVAFPIVECFDIVGRPKAKEVFTKDVWSRLFHKQSSTLSILDDKARAQIANLEILPVDAPNAIIGIEQDIEAAKLSELDQRFMDDLGKDLVGAMEGESEERKLQYRKRAAWIAGKFIKERKTTGTLYCDNCNFNPRTIETLTSSELRTCLDVHHKNPLIEGKRRTTINDFALLCPTCHRIEHVMLRKQIQK